MPKKSTVDAELFRYFPVSSQIMQLGLYVTGIGTQSNRPSEAPRAKGHPYLYWFTWEKGRVLPEYQMVYVTAGSGEFESRPTGLVSVEPGTALFLLPDVWHRYHAKAGCVWSCIWMSFNGEIPHRWQRAGILTPESAVRRVADADHFGSQFASLAVRTLQAPSQDMLAISLSALQLMALAVERTAAAAPPAPKELAPPRTDSLQDRLVARAVDLIWSHSHQMISVGLVARNLGLARRTFERRFLKARQHTALQEILNCRLRRAEIMLRNTHLPMKHIARAAGFTSATHLARTFRDRRGMTPGEFRRNMPPSGEDQMD